MPTLAHLSLGLVSSLLAPLGELHHRPAMQTVEESVNFTMHREVPVSGGPLQAPTRALPVIVMLIALPTLAHPPGAEARSGGE